MTEQIKVLSVPELAKESGMSAWTIRQLVKTGKLPCLELGNRWLIRLADFERLFTTKEETKDD